MLQFCKYCYNYMRLIYQINSYITYLNQNQDHNITYLDQICETIQCCGSVAIKFCQWITPKIELMYIEEKNLIDKDRNKPPWLLKLETFYEDCGEHSIEHTFQEYQRVFEKESITAPKAYRPSKTSNKASKTITKGVNLWSSQ